MDITQNAKLQNGRPSSRSTEDSSSRRIMRLVSVFTLEKNNQTNNECLPKLVQTDNAQTSINTANVLVLLSMISSRIFFYKTEHLEEDSSSHRSTLSFQLLVVLTEPAIFE